MKLLVHLHVYYHEQVDYFINRLSNITSCDWDLVVTESEENAVTERKLRSFKHDVLFLNVDNVGYDVWPFIQVIRSVDISVYDLIMKLHTKNIDPSISNRINGNRLRGDQWRSLLVDPLLYSQKNFLNVLGRFEAHPKTGIVFEKALCRKTTKGLPEDLSMLEKELQRLDVTTGFRRFCAGAMFVARAESFGKLRTHDIPAQLFTAGASHNIGSYAHVYERIICILVADRGLKFETLFTQKAFSVKALVNNMLSPALSFIFSVERVGEQRNKRIRILGISFRQDS